ncbi:MAG: symmetrical bis(5'-nucleosyl)-tetraphosphatase [Planctomycetes bacterium]|nr:symmetrical bis(5'-nucleosyl)-tetraphosphatase [Planctomycetota bacterium]
MASYAIGDLQGCFATYQRLLRRIEFRPGRDRLLLVGDLVNRGPRSLDVLRWTLRHDAHVHAVLGNHDLHLLAVAAGRAELRPGDTLDDVLDAPDRDELLDWLARRPLVARVDEHLLVHAGLHPSWTADDALALAAPLSARLADPASRGALLDALRRPPPGSVPPAWDADLPEPQRTRALIGLLTRLRTCRADGVPCERFSGPPDEAPAGCLPWFDVPGRRSAGTPIVCGHWAALGLCVRDDLLALDTGCVWGGSLTAARLEDGALFSEPACDGPPARD